MNRIELTGRLTRDPEMKATPSGVEVAQLRLAVPRRRRNGEDQGAVYVDVTAFDGQAIACGEYLQKGRRVAVSGRLELSEWRAQDGSSRQRHYVIADEVEFLDRAEAQPEETTGAAAAPQAVDGGRPPSAARAGGAGDARRLNVLSQPRLLREPGLLSRALYVVEADERRLRDRARGLPRSPGTPRSRRCSRTRLAYANSPDGQIALPLSRFQVLPRGSPTPSCSRARGRFVRAACARPPARARPEELTAGAPSGSPAPVGLLLAPA
jgi:single-strand DNA-binding protein